MHGIPPFRLTQVVAVTACLAVCELFCARASASFIISYSGNSITPGGTGVLEVLISSDAAVATPDLLDSFSAHFRIDPVDEAVSNGLQFAAVHGDSQLGDASYVFSGDSYGETYGGPLGLVSMLNNVNDTYIGGDATFSGAGFPLSVDSGPSLLFRFDLDATLANPGDRYTVSLINDGFTGFLDTAFEPLSLNVSSFDGYTISAGAAAVPEPASGGVFLLAGLAAAVWRRWKTRRPEPV